MLLRSCIFHVVFWPTTALLLLCSSCIHPFLYQTDWLLLYVITFLVELASLLSIHLQFKVTLFFNFFSFVLFILLLRVLRVLLSPTSSLVSTTPSLTMLNHIQRTYAHFYPYAQQRLWLLLLTELWETESPTARERILRIFRILWFKKLKIRTFLLSVVR